MREIATSRASATSAPPVQRVYVSPRSGPNVATAEVCPARAPPLGSVAMDDVRRFAEDAVVHVPPGPDEERLEDPRYVLTVTRGTHFWCVTVGKLRFERGG